ncbi:ABC transporter substrate-binding protein [Helicobacter apodemus]|uniref:Twin-arginine translocation pathway signal protein n=1 Tax=Helicobacter apodemus TaxID=135569 RepID=A0A2U8FB09_9HELI|nr:ABC transporter substrate-binding protein [Helicobacter apodemus]AWI33432.1 twin-arginine translocation pathway signal protein [Helicobacter apodemus]
MHRRKFLHLANTFFLSLSGLNILNAKELKIDFRGIKIGYLPITDHLLIIAKAFRNANFTPIKFASWSDLSEALLAKSIDGAFILTPLALKLASQKVKIKAILAAHRNGSALIVKKGLIQENDKPNIHLLKGLKIAIPSRFSTHYLLLADLLSQGNLTPDDIKLIDMPPPEMVFALKHKSIDGFIVAEPFGSTAQAYNIGDIFILSKDIIPNHICCLLTFHTEVLEAQKETIRTITKDFLETALFIQKQPQKAAEISTKFLGQKPTLIQNLLLQDDRVMYKNLAIKEEDITRTILDMQKYKIKNLHQNFEEFVDSSFIENAFYGD